MTFQTFSNEDGSSIIQLIEKYNGKFPWSPGLGSPSLPQQITGFAFTSSTNHWARCHFVNQSRGLLSLCQPVTSNRRRQSEERFSLDLLLDAIIPEQKRSTMNYTSLSLSLIISHFLPLSSVNPCLRYSASQPKRGFWDEGAKFLDTANPAATEVQLQISRHTALPHPG